MNILHLEANRYNSYSLDQLEEIGNLVRVKKNLDQKGLQKLLLSENYDVIFTRLGLYLGKKEFESQKVALKYIVSPTTGLNHIDVSTAEEYGVKIISLKGESNFLSSVQSTAEHTWTLILNLARNILPVLSSTRSGKWEREPFIANELNTQTLGIIGFGRLGKILLRYGQAFNLNIILYDIDETVFDDYSIQYFANLDFLLENSDYVVLLADFRQSNINMIDGNSFEKMKKTAYFINCSRGELVDEQALLNALLNKHIKGAALDVLDGDSEWKKIPSGHPLLDYARKNHNLLITPHIGGYGVISIERTREFITKKFLKEIHADNTNRRMLPKS
jgi:D-3-phosphoglycerate dehydrogenase